MRMTQQLNRLMRQKRCEQERQNPKAGSFRRARTRTLIQLGGLMEKSGLIDEFNIVLGDDLQQDLDKKDAVFSLLGALSDLKGRMTDEEEMNISLLKQKGAERFG